MKEITNHNQVLIERCKKGEHKAQLLIYKQYYKAMYTTAYRIVGNQYEAEDIMQDSFLAAFTKLDSFNGTSTFGAWLKRIVIIKSISSFQKNKKMQTVSLETTMEEISVEKNIEHINTNTNMAIVLQCLEKLKASYKIVLTLYFIEGYDYTEIASIMNISYQNSRTLMSRAKVALRKQLTL